MSRLRWRLAAAISACLLAAAPAFAQEGPEQLDQLEPGAGEWQAEYYGAFGGEGAQSAEAIVGITDTLAIGAEAEFEGPRGGLRFESAGLAILYRAIDPEDHAVGFGIKLQASIGGDGHLAEIESRAIVESRKSGWWLQGDLIVRNSRDQGAQGTGIAYGASVQRSLGGDIWLGIEASGQLARLSGSADLAPERRHYAGPSVTAELPIGDGEVEVGLAWLQRLRGDGHGSGPRIFAQFTF